MLLLLLLRPLLPLLLLPLLVLQLTQSFAALPYSFCCPYGCLCRAPALLSALVQLCVVGAAPAPTVHTAHDEAAAADDDDAAAVAVSRCCCQLLLPCPCCVLPCHLLFFPPAAPAAACGAPLLTEALPSRYRADETLLAAAGSALYLLLLQL